ncbi:MAG: signal peptidase I [Lachnospiraceae bacterium]|nr:signal peptidase I [Lachnospiraceae bacterium]
MKVRKEDKHGYLEREKEKRDARAEARKETLDFIVTMAVVALAVFLLMRFVIINARIPTASMEETICVNDRIFGNRLAYLNHDPERYDIVVFKFPDNEKKLYIKRIIGLPGETVEIIGGKVYIDGAEEPLRDDFCPETPVGDFGPYVVPENCYFMLGDNRNGSADSRYWQNPYVARDKILGKAGLRYWPLTDFGFVK